MSEIDWSLLPDQVESDADERRGVDLNKAPSVVNAESQVDWSLLPDKGEPIPELTRGREPTFLERLESRWIYADMFASAPPWEKLARIFDDTEERRAAMVEAVPEGEGSGLLG